MAESHSLSLVDLARLGYSIYRSLSRIEGGTHAVLRHVGDYAGLEDATDLLLAHWLHASGHALRDAPVHYHYLDDPESVPAALLRADLHLPLSPG